MFSVALQVLSGKEISRYSGVKYKLPTLGRTKAEATGMARRSYHIAELQRRSFK